MDEVDEMETFPDSMSNKYQGSFWRARSGSSGLPIREGARMGTAGFSRAVVCLRHPRNTTTISAVWK